MSEQIGDKVGGLFVIAIYTCRKCTRICPVLCVEMKTDKHDYSNDLCPCCGIWEE